MLGAERLARKGTSGVEVHGKSLPGVEQLDEQPWVRPEAVDVLCSEEGLGVGAHGIAQRPSVGQHREAIVFAGVGRIVDPTQSSGTWSPVAARPRSSAMRAPPR